MPASVAGLDQATQSLNVAGGCRPEGLRSRCFTAYRFPGFVGNIQENIRHLQVIHVSCPSFDYLSRYLERKSAAVRPVGSHGVKSIRYGKNPRAHGNLRCLQAPRIAASIATFVMREDDFRGVRKERDASDHVIPNLYVLLHDLAFIIGEGTWFEKNAVRDCQLAYVVQPRAHGDIPELMLQAAQGFRNLDGVQEHAAGMPGCRAVPQIDGCSQHFQRVIVAALDLAESFSELLRLLRNHFLEVVAVILDFLLQALLMQGAGETRGDDAGVNLEGLDEIVVCALLHGSNADLNIVRSRDHQKSYLRMEPAHLHQQIHTRNSRHAQVRNYGIQRLGLEKMQSFFSTAGLCATNANLSEHSRQHLAGCWFIVDDQHAHS